MCIHTFQLITFVDLKIAVLMDANSHTHTQTRTPRSATYSDYGEFLWGKRANRQTRLSFRTYAIKKKMSAEITQHCDILKQQPSLETVHEGTD